VKRRTVLAGACALAAMAAVRAQQPAKLRKIGIISFGVAANSPHFDAFRRGLREHGYVEGKNIALEYRFAQGDAARLPALAAELVRLNVDVIVTEGVPTALAANQATKKIPIVMAGGADPVRAGLAVSLARPGGNTTGLTFVGASRVAKQLQLLKEMVPGATIVAAIYNPTRPDIEDDLQSARETARALRLAVQFFAVSTPDDFEAAFAAVTSARPSALITIGHGMLFANTKRIADFALKSRLPAVFPEREFAQDGGLMAYGPDIGWNFHRVAGYVDRILKGAKPGDLPIERPNKWDLTINLRTAKALGLKIPGSLLVRADEVIE
jgi:putative ABC transport system substrate-binding protein